MSTLWVVLALLVGIGIGWVAAHGTIATECERLGRFYVGNKTFECRRVHAASAQGEKE